MSLPFLPKARLPWRTFAAAVPIVLVAFVLLHDGGAGRSGPEVVPELLEWRFLADDELLCDQGRPCDAAHLAALANAGETCRFDARVLMSNAASPWIARDVRWKTYIVYVHGDPPTGSPIYADTSPEPALWVRSLGQVAEPVVELPCDTHFLRMSVNWHGKTLLGGGRGMAETVEISLNPQGCAGYWMC